ncbi:hypothetical protein ACU4HD_19700 [Cupriavidus basilensis]
MTQLPQDHTIQNLLAFYDRVNPILSEWLGKPVWTARETAMLCAGYVPEDNQETENPAASDLDSIAGGTPIDPRGYVPPNRRLCRASFILLEGRDAASPRDMVKRLGRLYSLTVDDQIHLMVDGSGQSSRKEVGNEFTAKVFNSLQWLLIIGNTVGLPVPARVPFGLLNALRDRLSDQSITELSTRQEKAQLAEAGAVAETKPSTKRQKLRGRQPLQTTPEKRGYHTTEEVAGLTNLLPDTLNKYAREGIAVEGFTPFKRQNGRSWQWRDGPQQALHTANTAGQAILGSQQVKSLSALLGPEPFRK